MRIMVSPARGLAKQSAVSHLPSHVAWSAVKNKTNSMILISIIVFNCRSCRAGECFKDCPAAAVSVNYILVGDGIRHAD